jgi:integrase
MKKRIYGEGSITHRKDGRFYVSVPDPSGRNGRRGTYAKSEREAEKLRRKLLADVERGHVPESKQPFRDHAHDWMEIKRRGGYAPNTYFNMRTTFDAHFLPALGDLPLNEITASNIQNIYNKMLDAGLSPNSVRRYHSRLKSCLDLAVKQGKIEINPCRRVELPRAKKPKNACLEEEEVHKLLEACSEHQLLKTLVPLALASSAREGELLALTWQDVDLEAGILRINKSLSRGLDQHGRQTISSRETKTESSVREILLPSFAVDALRLHRNEQREWDLSSGRRNRANLIFCTRNGTPIYANNMTRIFKRFATRLGLGHVTFHDLRHTSATMLLEDGASAIAVQQRLGHSDIKITLGVYGHSTKRLQDQAAKLLDSRFSKRAR